jgi:hypothetical protein
MRPFPHLRHRSALRAALPPVVFAGLALGQLLALRQADYSKAWLLRATVEEARAPRDPLALGPLRWDPAPYQSAPSLAPLRNMVATHCAGLPAVATAECLADLFAQRFAHGVPAAEFFDARYSPADDLAAHLAGAPGHCVTRSGLLAAALLAAGIPARVVQLRPLSGGGHNVAEVWDQANGWVYIDPTYRLTVEGMPGTTSAAASLRPKAHTRWRVNTAMREVAGTGTETAFLYDNMDRLLGGHLVYPDPWAYTRVGRQLAPWPFQARFVVVGPLSLRLGLLQRLLHVGIALALLALATSVVSPLVRLSRRSPRKSRELAAQAPAPVRPVPVGIPASTDVEPPGSAVG